MTVVRKRTTPARWSTLWAATLTICVLQTPLCAADPLDLVAPVEARLGDVAALAKRWFEIVKRNPDSQEAQAVLLLWPRHIPVGAAEAPSANDWRAVLESIRANGWSARQVLWQLHRQLLVEGDLDGAATLDLEAGNPRRWLGVGPFGNFPNVALHATFAPEVEFDPGAEYEGTNSTVSWRDVFLPHSETRIDPASEWQRQGAVYYLRARFALGAETDAFVQASGAGSFQIYVDGARLLAADRAREQLPQVLRAGARLSAGEHVVLVKTTRSSVSVLFRDARGFPLHLDDLDPREAAALSHSSCVPLPELSAIALVTAASWDSWRAGTLLPEWRLPLAELLIQEGGDFAGRELLLADEKEPRDVVALAMAAIANAPALDYLPGDWKKNWLDDLANRALESDPLLVPVRLHKAEQLAEDGKEAEAFRLLDEVIETQPQSIAAWLTRAALAQRQGWEREWIDSLLRLEEMYPQSPDVLARLIQYRASHCKLPARALPYRERRFAVAPTLESGAQLAAAYAQAGKIDDALELWTRLEKITGNSTPSLRAKLDFLTDRGMPELALRVANSLAARVPDDAGVRAYIGNLHLQEGRLAEAADAYRSSLALQPGQMRLLRTLRYITAKQDGKPFVEDEFWAAHAIDGDRAIAEAPSRERYPKAAAVYIVDQAVTRFAVDGGVEEMVHQVVRLDSKQSVDEFSQINVPGEILEIRIITPEGKELHPTAGENDSSYTLPGLEPGSIVEYRSIDRHDLERPKDAAAGPFYFRDAGNANAYHRSEMVLLYPASWSPEIRERAMPIAAKEREADLYLELTWRADEMDRMEPENLAPPADEIVPNIAMLPQAEWEDELDEVASRAVRNDFVSPELASATQEILAGVAGDRRAQVAALYNAVCDRVKASGPSANATSVWLLRSGNRDLLLAGMLRAARIPFDRIAAAAKDSWQPFTDWSRPNAGLFGSSLLRIAMEDGDYMYVTAGYRMVPPGRVPLPFQGARAVIARESGGEWTALPASPPDTEAQALSAAIDLGPGDELVKISGQLEWRQINASGFKDQVIAMNDFSRTTWLERLLQQLLPGSRIIKGEFPDLEERTPSFRVQLEVENGNLLQDGGGRTLLKAVFLPARLRDRYVRKAERVHPLVSTMENVTIEEYEILLGGRYRVTSLPVELDLCGAWGTYHLGYRLEGDRVLVTRRLQLVPFQVAPQRFQEFIDVCSTIDHKEEERIALAKVGP